MSFDSKSIIASISTYHEKIPTTNLYSNSTLRPSYTQTSFVNEAIDKIVGLAKEYLEKINIEDELSSLKTIRSDINVIQSSIFLIKSLKYSSYDISPLERAPVVEKNLENTLKKLCLIEAKQIRTQTNPTKEELEWAYWATSKYQG